MKGRLRSGEKKGAEFVKIFLERIKRKTGFEPYPGTLNLECEKPSGFISQLEEKEIGGFEKNGKKYGSVKLYPVKLGSLEAAIVRPEKTRHPKEIVEIIAPIYIRGTFKLEDGDELEVGK